MGRRNRILLRELYLQNLENEQRTDHIISNDNPNIIAPVSGIRRTSRKRFFQNLDVEGTSADFEDGRAYKSGELDAIANALDSSSSFGQAHYQRRKQGVVIEYKDFGDDTFECAHCNAYYWRDEMNTRGVYTGCCKGGQVRLQPSNQTPPFLEYLLESKNGAKSKHFQDNIRVYNSMFAFTSMGADIIKDINKESGPYVFKICGQVHHLMGSVLPLPGETPKFAQLYVYDTQNELSNRINALSPNKKQRIDPDIVNGLIQMFNEINELTKIYRNIRDKFKYDSLPSVNMTMLSHQPFDSKQYEKPTNEEIAGLIVGDIGEFNSNKDVVVYSNDGYLKRISKIHPKYMSLQYPILFPYGEDGYRINLYLQRTSRNENSERKRMSMRNFIAYQIHDRSNQSSTLLRGGRLFQQYLVDAYATVEENELDYIRKHNDDFRIEKKMDIFAASSTGITESRDVGQRIILPSSHTGSPRDMINNYHDAMAICRQYGNPDLFITFTCNPKWLEIISSLVATTCFATRDDITSFSLCPFRLP